MTKPIRYVDLFAGVGGFRAAIEQTAKQNGFVTECVGFSEIDAHALKTYHANFRLHKNEVPIGDISKLSLADIKSIPQFDVLFAGFPCQPFSLMGDKAGFEDARGTLFFQIAKILLVKKPDFFILENVRGIKTHDQGKTYERIVKILTEELGYNLRTELLNSIDFGVPQHRRRLYFIGVKRKKDFRYISNAQFDTPISKTQYKTVWHLLEREVDEKYYLSKKMIKTILEHGSGGYYSKSEINRIHARPLTATMHKMHRANQDNYYSDNFIQGAFDGQKVLPAQNGHDRIRKLTPKEAFRLQGFDDSFAEKAQKAGVSDTQLYRQAGNAITLNVAKSVLETLFTNSPRLQKGT